MTDAFFETMSGLPPREPPFWMILKLFRTACCSGEASQVWIGGLGIVFLRLPCRLYLRRVRASGCSAEATGDAHKIHPKISGQRHNVRVDGISRADCGGNCTAADWRHGFV